MRKGIVLSVVVLVLVVAYLNRDYLLKSYASWFVVDNATKGADLILLLGGNIISRSAKGIDLYKRGYAPQIALTTTPDIDTPYPDIIKSQRELLMAILEREGISDFIAIPSLKNGATSTFDEAYDMAHFLQNNPQIKRVIVVTDGFHSRRAKIAFDKVFERQGITTKIEWASKISNRFALDQWHRYESSLFRLLIQEPLGILFYLFNDGNSELYVNE